jgi:hypothetical protein
LAQSKSSRIPLIGFPQAQRLYAPSRRRDTP